MHKNPKNKKFKNIEILNLYRILYKKPGKILLSKK